MKPADRKAGAAGPWPDVATARLFFEAVLAASPDQDPITVSLTDVDGKQLGAWLKKQELAPLVHRARLSLPANTLAAIRQDTFTVAAYNTLHQKNLTEILNALAAKGLPVVLLKGMALAVTAYGGLSWRPMSDVDIWAPDDILPAIAAEMTALGFVYRGKEARPLVLQSLSGGEVPYVHPDRARGLVELHWSPMPGWWLKRTTAVDIDGMWARKQALVADGLPSTAQGGVFCLSPEDMVLQVAVHLAVNHQFGMAALRGLLDIALSAQTWPVAWQAVVDRAQRWRIGTVIWLVLDIAEQVLGLAETKAARGSIRPSFLRRWLLRRYVTPASVLAGRDLRNGRQRFLFLLLLVDRPRDMLKLIWRTLWPEDEWLEARYAGETGRWGHLWQVVRYGNV